MSQLNGQHIKQLMDSLYKDEENGDKEVKAEGPKNTLRWRKIILSHTEGSAFTSCAAGIFQEDVRF